MNQNFTSLSAHVGAVWLLAASPSFAAGQYQPVTIVNTDIQTMASQYWTPERFKAAKPLPLPTARADAVHPVVIPAMTREIARSANGQPPMMQIRTPAQQLFVPEVSLQRMMDASGITPQASGTFNTPYTSTRVFPMHTDPYAAFSADRAYPYVTVGKLFFTKSGSPFVCSASVIQRRVVATAGHCVHSGTAAGFHSNVVFVPAFRDGAAPLKQWNWTFMTTTAAWASGGGTVPNAGDFAMIEFGDQAMVPGGPLTKLGYVTGWLGWQTLALNNNHTSKLGYPCNLDSCQKMQNVASSAYRAVAPNNVEYGSDATGGSSGGPWVQNLAVMAVGGGTGNNVGQNRVVGITSYGYTDVAPKVQGSSILNDTWVALWNSICARVGNCS
jgi:V8-like Glu-specific endopeptidase